MRAVIQRVQKASICVDNQTIAAIDQGLLILLAVHRDDNADHAKHLAHKCAGLRIIDDDQGQMNLSISETTKAVCVVSQFTLYGDCAKGKRPSFDAAATPQKAQELYEMFISHLRDLGLQVVTGRFRAMMQVSLINDGPVTVIVESNATH